MTSHSGGEASKGSKTGAGEKCKYSAKAAPASRLHVPSLSAEKGQAVTVGWDGTRRRAWASWTYRSTSSSNRKVKVEGSTVVAVGVALPCPLVPCPLRQRPPAQQSHSLSCAHVSHWGLHLGV